MYDLSNLLELMDPIEGRVQRTGVQSEDYLDSKETKPVNLKGNQLWIFTRRTDAETPILWPPDAKNWLIGKDPDAGKDWRQEEKGTTENEMVGWHHRLDGHEFEQAPGVGDGQRSLACCSPWGCRESDITEWLNNNRRLQAKWIKSGLWSLPEPNISCYSSRVFPVLLGEFKQLSSPPPIIS